LGERAKLQFSTEMFNLFARDIVWQLAITCRHSLSARYAH
jgi:hypothetical protein